jgi:hypothetical protein
MSNIRDKMMGGLDDEVNKMRDQLKDMSNMGGLNDEMANLKE